MPATYEERKTILSKPYLTSEDVMKLEECQYKTARKIMCICMASYGGRVVANSHRITTDSYLQYTGLEKGAWYTLMSAFGSSKNNA